MATTPIQFPGLPTGLTLTCQVMHPTTLTVEETVTLTEASSIYSGNVTGTSAGQKIFIMKASGSIIGSRVRTIQDTTATFIILSELETSESDGRGAYPVTVTINDGVSPIVGASVRVTATGQVATQTTNGSGIAYFALNNGTYTATVTAVGYGAVVDTLTVSGASSDTYSMTAIVITPPTSALVSTGIMVCFSDVGVEEQGVTISIKLVSGPGTDGYAYDTATRTDVSDADGLVTFAGMIRGATYQVWRGDSSGTTGQAFFGNTASASDPTCVVPNSDTFNLPECTGQEA